MVKKDDVDPKKYYIVYDYFKQYAAGVTGVTHRNEVYHNDGAGFDTRQEATDAAKAAGLKNYKKRGKDDGYGEVGYEEAEVKIKVGRQIIKDYNSYSFEKLKKR